MTVLLFVTHFLKRNNTYTYLFSTAISEGIKDVFKEMGYGREEMNKKTKAGNSQASQVEQSKNRFESFMDNLKENT